MFWERLTRWPLEGLGKGRALCWAVIEEDFICVWSYIKPLMTFVVFDMAVKQIELPKNTHLLLINF